MSSEVLDDGRGSGSYVDFTVGEDVGDIFGNKVLGGQKHQHSSITTGAYTITCKKCDALYIGETSKDLHG